MRVGVSLNNLLPRSNGSNAVFVMGSLRGMSVINSHHSLFPLRFVSCSDPAPRSGVCGVGPVRAGS